MKLNCGRTWKEQREDKEKWHEWFAWRPINFNKGNCRWLEKIWRKGVWICGLSRGFWSWEYSIEKPEEAE